MSPVELTDGREGEGEGEEPNDTNVGKPSTLEFIHYSLTYIYKRAREGPQHFADE